MSESTQTIDAEPIHLKDLAAALPQTRIFASTPFESIAGPGRTTIDQVDRVTIRAGTMLIEAGQPWHHYWVVLSGEMRADRPESDGVMTTVGMAKAGEGFGEVPFLNGYAVSTFRITAVQDSVLVRFSEQDFWSLLACCPEVRKTIIADSSVRVQAYQVEALHREKLVSLGTMAAGLMHELNNPGAAAKRAATQLRENLLRLQQLSLRNSGKAKTPAQLQCMRDLLEHALRSCNLPAMSSLEQVDAEEAMSQWLEKASVENAFTIGPVLVSMGIGNDELACAQDHFDPTSFSDALNWFGALVSSVSLVCAIEESISRITELVTAVKKFAYDERTPERDLDVHDSLQSTLTILGHKIRLKEIRVEKRFAASPSTIRTKGYALSQVWTNLIDNAVDASPQGGKLEISTSSEPDWLVVSIGDNGSGIPADVLPRIFEPFFTTKPQGSGTGLGLEIVHRIVTQKFSGKLEVQSKPGDTRFIIRLPVTTPAA